MKNRFNLYLDNKIYGSGNLNYVSELIEGYLKTHKMFGNNSSEFKIINCLEDQRYESPWSEIVNFYIDESDEKEGVVEMNIDAWRTGDGDETGSVIAKILSIKTDKGNIVRTVYIDNQARIDEYAQRIIKDGEELMKNYSFK